MKEEKLGFQEVPMEKYILEKYQGQIDYYKGASTSNKNAYKLYRSLAIILGALVTLISSISSATFIESNKTIATIFAITTPVVAALLTMISGLAQSFHWGATWRDMIINAERMEKERDRFLATKPEGRNMQKELDVLHSIVIEETTRFFERVLDSEVKPEEEENNK